MKIDRARFLSFAFALGGVPATCAVAVGGCATDDGSVPPTQTTDSGNAPNDTGTPSPLDTGTLDVTQVDGGCATVSGAGPCSDVITSYCVRVAQCCNAGGGCAANGCTWGCQIDSCRAENLRVGWDCASSKYSNVQVCSDSATKCIDDWQTPACADVLRGVANMPTSCRTFWGQFGPVVE